MFRLFTLMVLLLGAGGLSAQQTRNYSLQQTVEEVLQNNWNIRKVEQMVGMAKSDVTNAHSSYLPSVSLSETFINTNSPMMAFGTKLDQGRIAQPDFNPDLLNDPNDITNFRTSVEVNQPIFNWDGIQGRKAAGLAYDAAIHDKVWAEKMLVLQTKNLYYQLAITKRGKLVVEKAKEAADESHSLSQNLFEQGLISKADLMGAELYATQMQSQLLQINHSINNLNQQMLQMLGSSDGYIVIPVDSVPHVSVNIDDLNKLSISKDRSDLMSMKLKAEAGNANYNSKKGSFIPRVNAFGSYNLNGTQFFGNQANNYLVGAQLKWDLFSGGKNWGGLQKARYEKDYATITYQEKLSASQRNLVKLKNDFELAKKQVALTELAVKQTKELYKIRKDRYQEGLEKTSDLIADESNYMQKQIDWLRSQHKYLQLLFQLEVELSQNLIN